MTAPPDAKRCTATTRTGERCRQHRYVPEEVCRTHMPDEPDEPRQLPPVVAERRLVVGHAPPDEATRCGSCGGQGELPEYSVGVFQVPEGQPRDDDPLCRRCLEEDPPGMVLGHYLKLWARVVRDLDEQTVDRLQALLTDELDAVAIANLPRTEW